MTYNDFEGELNRLFPKPEDYLGGILPPEDMGMGTFLRKYIPTEFIDRYNAMKNLGINDIYKKMKGIAE